MSAFSPEVPPIPRPASADVLACFVPSALRRTPAVAKLWRWPRLVLVGVATAGYVPAFALQVRMRRVLMMHAQQCELSTQLLAGTLPPDEAQILNTATANVRTGEGLLAASLVATMVSLSLALTRLATWHGAHGAFARLWFQTPRPGDAVAWLQFGFLAAAYFALIVQMNRQLVAMQQFALAFNATCGERLGPVDPPPLVWGLRPKYLLAGVGLAYVGLLWGLPMMLAWGAFKSFVEDAAYRFRVRLADRVQSAGGIESVVPTIDLCPNPDCRNGLAADAAFCPRCGTPLLAAAP